MKESVGGGGGGVTRWRLRGNKVEAETNEVSGDSVLSEMK